MVPDLKHYTHFQSEIHMMYIVVFEKVTLNIILAEYS